MSDKKNTAETKYASFSLRMFASAIDSILSVFLIFPIMKLISMFVDVQQSDTITIHVQQLTFVELLDILQQGMANFLLQSLIFAIAVIIFWTTKGGTPGKILLRMKVVDTKTLENPSVMQSVIRYLGYFVSFLPFLLGFIWIYYDKKGQGFHDKIAGTVVIVDKNKN